MVSLQEILTKHMRPVENKLRKLFQEEYPKAIIRSGAWNNPSIVTAYTSVFPGRKPTDDSIDFILQVIVSETSFEFRADISLSSGELIDDILNEVSTFRNRDELINKVIDQSRKASNILADKVMELYIKGNFIKFL